MNLLYLSTWSTIMRVAATESGSPIISFSDPVQAIHHMYLENAAGNDIQVITNDGESYWLVSAALAAKLYKANFYPMLGANCIPEEISDSMTYRGPDQ